jgi:hypothetical protein
MRMDREEALRVAARDTLVHIAGMSGRAARDLRPGQSLTVDLGLADPDLAALSLYQHRVARRLHRSGPVAPLSIDELYDCVVWEVLALTVQGATGQCLDTARACALLVEAAARLRGASHAARPGPPPGDPSGRG